MQTTLGDRYTENVEGIYKLTIKFIIETLITGFESANSKNDSSANNNSNARAAISKSWNQSNQSNTMKTEVQLIHVNIEKFESNVNFI